MLRLWRSRSPFVDLDEPARRHFDLDPADAVGLTHRLVDYFWRAHLRYRHRHGTMAYYPGWGSIYGARSDAVEGVTRLLPLWAAYGSSPDGDPAWAQALAAAVADALAYGTDPAHAGYWGDIQDRSTLICEAADVALAVWLAGPDWWAELSPGVRSRTMAWLRQAIGRRTADNNWHLFVVWIDAVLARLDPAHRYSSAERLDRIRSFGLPDGCFRDGPGGRVDYYNAWGFHYLLFWLGEIDEDLPGEGLRRALPEFCHWYQWLFTADGLPLFGRSLCYRFAVSAPLLTCVLRDPRAVSPGVALSAYLSTWRFFMREGGLQAGRPAQGVFGDDIRWLDDYSGPASSLWGTRSLVAFLYARRRIDWRLVERERLPATTQRAVMHVAGLGATITTDPEAGLSTLEFDVSAGRTVDAGRVESAPKRLLREAVMGVPRRDAVDLHGAGERRFGSDLLVYRRAT